ncbi:MAG: hypothetical protein KIH62_002820 [Candidatus Kerfeldbacteria bacterium]|nr:hypothetical protein [Candidatus Kerfeldbacteria bacterium]
MVSPEVEQFTMTLLMEAGISASDRYKDELAAQVERRIAIAITETVDSRTAVELERALVFQDTQAIRELVGRIPGIQKVIERELTIFRSEYLNAIHA